MAKQRIVLDTNIWLDWLLFEDTGIARIRQLQEAGRLEIVVNAECEAEFAGVIGRQFRKKILDARAQAAALAQLRRLSTRIDVQPTAAERARLPRCRDPHDQKFLELALAGGAGCLLTKDRELLALSRRKLAQVGRGVPFRIVHPDEF